MRVKCPQCGKEFSIPDTEAHRLLKCVCKSLFRANENRVDAVLDVSKTEVKLEAKGGFYLEDEDTSEPDTSITGAQLDNYLDTLKKNRTEIVAKDSITSPPVTNIRGPQMDSIELGESRAEKKSESKKKDTKDIDELSRALGISEDSISNAAASSDLKAFSQQSSRVSRVKAAPVRERSALDLDYLWDRFQDLSLPVQISGGLAIAVPLGVITFFLLREPEKVQEQMDPQLVKLLTPRTVTEEPEPVTPKKAPPALESPKKAAPSKPAPPPEVDNRRYLEMRKNSFEGNFEHVIRIGAPARAKLSPEELALYFEAQMARATRNQERLGQIAEDVRQTQKAKDDSTALIRALASAELRLAKDAAQLRRPLEMLKSLGLTRARDPLVYAYLGMVYEKLERLDLAHEVWDQALTLEPKLVWLIERRIQIFRVTQDPKNAKEMAERLTTIEGFEAKGYRDLAAISSDLGDKPQAQKYLKQALKFKDDPELRIELAEAAPNPKEAVSELMAGLKVAKSARVKAMIFSRLGRIYCASKQTETALRFLREAAKQDPTLADAHYERGVCERNTGGLAKSLNAFEAALKLDPENYAIWLDYALSLKMDQKIKPALSAVQHSLELQATDSGYLLLAELLKKLGRNQEALINAKKASKINPKNQKARLLVSELTR